MSQLIERRLVTSNLHQYELAIDASDNETSFMVSIGNSSEIDFLFRINSGKIVRQQVFEVFCLFYELDEEDRLIFEP